MNPLKDWREFWFTPHRLTHVGLFRIAIGLVAVMKLLLLWPVASDFFTDEGTLTLALSQQMYSPRLSVFDYLPPDAAPTILLVTLGVSVLFTLGLWTRVMTIALFIGLVSLDHRNHLILNSGDRLLAILLFFGSFAPLGSACSLDRLIAWPRGRVGPEPPSGPYWAVRLMQLQVCMVYLWSAYFKIRGNSWVEGIAVYWTTRNLERARWPLPPLLTDTMAGINVLTYFTMLVEVLFPFLVWSKRARPYILLAAFLLHLGIEYSMTISIFEYVMFSTLLLFLDDAQLGEVWARFRKWAEHRSARPSPRVRALDR